MCGSSESSEKSEKSEMSGGVKWVEEWCGAYDAGPAGAVVDEVAPELERNVAYVLEHSWRHTLTWLQYGNSSVRSSAFVRDRRSVHASTEGGRTLQSKHARLLAALQRQHHYRVV